MKTTETIKKCLRSAAGSEAHAVVQYLADSACLENWGIPKLAEKVKKEAGEEQGHLYKLLERMTFVEATPEFEVESPVYSKSVGEIINKQLEMERGAVSLYQGCVDLAMKTDDKGTGFVFLKILEEEEGHLNWLEGQKSLLDKLGEKDYTLYWLAD